MLHMNIRLIFLFTTTGDSTISDLIFSSCSFRILIIPNSGARRFEVALESIEISSSAPLRSACSASSFAYERGKEQTLTENYTTIANREGNYFIYNEFLKNGITVKSYDTKEERMIEKKEGRFQGKRRKPP